MVEPTTETLVVECLLGIDWERMNANDTIYAAIAQKCLSLKQEGLVGLLEGILRESKHQEVFESYLIQKTLNCTSSEMISE